MKQKTQFILTAVLGCVLGITLTISVGYYRVINAAPSYEFLELFTKVLHFVQTNYVEEVEPKKLIEGAIKGMLATLDPHTVYLPAEQFKEMQTDTSGKFGGLGIEITINDGYLSVVTPIEDTPAFYEGVEPGDKIVIIEDKVKKIKKETKGMSLQEAVNLMRGEKGSKVTIHVVRKGINKILPIEIKRDIIKIVAVKGGLIEKDYGWVRITNFQSNTGADVKKRIEKIEKENKGALKGIVLDLRSNPGGLLEEAINVSGIFLGKVPVVSTVGRNKSKKEVEVSRFDKPAFDNRLVVLVNEASASASEIVAGALQDHKRAIIVGKQTFGKGSVQTVIDLENKAGLKLTVARYYTPNGRSIQGKGIEPDIEVERIDAEALEKAKSGRSLREADLENHIVGESETEMPIITSSEETKDGADGKDSKDKDKRPIREKDGRRVRVDDPKELIKTDFQLQQAVSYLKAWDIFEAAAHYKANKPDKTASKE